ncbi:transglycosylase domain-containing protein [Cryobacterium sp. 1639]|uniref:transglycosylase domain-containing protein n=1 Tax=Cryobacterium inferilacus TaxID=2866629 RepID=UPI001C735711|nr:transglycosylase domain-containing protein [Cryobacterium sp. 1639]MBX0299887.1 transglycosylase domain-containing protein [Cryobacterium sp. 1639]
MGEYRRSFAGVVGGLIGIVAMSSVAGLLITVAITPALAISGVATRTTINTFENLPNYLPIDALSQVSTIYAVQNDGTPYALASFYDQNRIEVPLQATSQFVRDAAVAGEDPRFYEHGGIDLQGTIRGALSTLGPSGNVTGGSSITQQYVKNVLVQQCEVMTVQEELDACFLEATKTEPDRKLKEMRLAIGVEKQYSKDDILQGYLNITGFGGTVYGIEAAARYYYNASAGTLTLPQSASLIAIVNNPEKFRLDYPASETNGAANEYAANKVRRDYILNEMLTYEKITQEQYDEAIATVIAPVITEPSTGCQTAGGAGFFCDYVTHVLKTDPTFGADADERMLNFRRGGYEIYTTLDLDLQLESERAINENVPMTASWDVGAVATSVQVGTGRVLTMAQNKKYTQLAEAPGPEYTGINYNTNFDQGGSIGFQPGSTYKVFTLAEWLSEGHALGERVDSSLKPYWGSFQDSCNGTYSEQFPLRNDSGESGPNYSALESTINSYNTGFMGMAKRLDLCGIREQAEAFGIRNAGGGPLLQTPATVLGTNEVAPLNMAVAYAGIANKGTTCSPVVIDRIVGADDVEIPAPTSTCTESVTPDVAAGMAYAMERVLTSGSARESNGKTFPKVPMIGKTGTTDKSFNTWMSGASSKVATVVGVVNVKGYQSQRGTNFFSGAAATARHRMWPIIMSAANAKYGGDAFEAASSDVVQGRQVSIPDVRGLSVNQARSAIEGAGFAFRDGGITDSELPAGTIARSEPNGSTVTGALVTVFTSNESQVLLPDVVGQTLAEAKESLAGFGVGVLEEDVPTKAQVGKVTVMNPVAGTPAIPGGTVYVVVGTEGPNTADTPPAG